MKKLLLISLFLAFSIIAFGQLTVTVTNPGNTTPNLAASYSSFASALTDLNAVSAMTGPVILTLSTGSETAPIKGFVIGSATLNPVLSATNTVTINTSGGTVTINAGIGTATPSTASPDGMLYLNGADYVTIDGLTFTDGNTTNPATMEFGIALFKRAAGDGCNYNTIKNCTFNMQRVNNAAGSGPMPDGSSAILVPNSTAAAATTALTPTNGGTLATNGTNSNNMFYSNQISNGNNGIVLMGFAATAGVGPSPTSTTFLGDLGNDIGGTSSGQGNTILNYGGGAATSPAVGIRANNQWSVNISYNTVNNNNGSGVNHATTLRGIFAQAGTSAAATINYNAVTVQSGATTSLLTAIDNGIGSTALSSNTININNNTIRFSYTTATSGLFTAVNNSATAGTVNINNNNIQQLSSTNYPSTGTVLVIVGGSPGGPLNINNNTISNFVMTGASGTLRGITATTPTGLYTVTGNTIENLSYTTTTSTGSITGIYNLSSATLQNWNNNIIRNFSTPTTGTLNGIQNNTVTGTFQCKNNQIYNFTTTSGGAGGFTANGITWSNATSEISGNVIYSINSTGSTGGASGTIAGISVSGSSNIFRNKIYDISTASTTTTSGAVNGIRITGGTLVNVYNNFIGDLRATASGATDAIRGINITSTTGSTSYNVYYNTIFINATPGVSATNFGTSGLFHTTSTTSTTAALDLKNNIIVNKSTAKGTGLTVAYRRSSAALGNYVSTSNNNLFYAGAPSASNLIFHDGTNPDQLLSTYKTRVAPIDAASISEQDDWWLSTIGSDAGYLHINNTIATGIESGGTPIAITTDYDSDLRQNDPSYSGGGTAPDIGADEFEGTPLSQCSGTPTASNISGAASVCTGTGTNLSLDYVYTDIGITFLWKFSTTAGGPYTDMGTSASQATGNLTQTTYFICDITCTNSGETVTTAEKQISINTLPNVQVTPSSGTYCTPGGAAVALAASGANTYSWSPAAGLSATTGANVNATPTTSTTYTVTGTDANNCVNTATATVTVAASITASATATPPSICSGSNSQLNVTTVEPAKVGTYSFNATSDTYTEISGGTVLGNTSIDEQVFNNNTAGASAPVTNTGFPIGFNFVFAGNTFDKFAVATNGYIVLGTGSFAIANSPSAAISNSTVAGFANLIAPWNQDLQGQTGSELSYLTSGSPGDRVLTIQWKGFKRYLSTATLNLQMQLHENGNLIKFVYGSNTIASVYNGQVGLRGADNTEFNTRSTSTDWMTTTSGTNSSTCAMSNTVVPATGTTFTFTPPTLFYTYAWTPTTFIAGQQSIQNPLATAVTATTNYTVTVTAASGCAATSNVTVTTVDNAVINTQPVPEEKCAGQNASFTVDASGPGLIYQWRKGGIDIAPLANPSAATATLTLNNVSAGDAGNYDVVVTANCGLPVTSDVAALTVKPVPTATASSNSPVCTGSTLQLSGSTDIGTSFTWIGTNGFSNSNQSPSIPSATLAAGGTYSFTASLNGCASAVSQTAVVVNLTPSAVIVTPATPTINPGDIQELTATGGTISGSIISENFNSGVGTFTVVASSSTPAQDWTPRANGYVYSSYTFSGSTSGFMLANSDIGGSGATTNTQLISPSFSTIGWSGLSLQFKEHLNNATDIAAAVEISSDDFATSTILRNDLTNDFGTLSSFNSTTLSIPASFEGQANVKIRFRYEGSWDWFWAVDEFNVTGSQTTSITWSPVTDLYTDALATTPYISGTDLAAVYAKPTLNTVYTATATSGAGCTNSGTSSVTVTYPQLIVSTQQTIGSSATYSDIIVEPTGQLTLNAGNTLTANGNFIIESDATGTGSFIQNGTLNIAGDAIVQKYLPNTTTSGWTLSVPIQDAPISVFDASDNIWYFDAPTASWQSFMGLELEEMTGYVVRFSSGNTTVEFLGDLNNGTMSRTDFVRQASPNNFGWNHTGNPYPSPVNIDANPGVSATNLNAAVYYRMSSGNVASYIRGSGFTGTNGGTNIIPSMQAFWVQVSTGQTTGSLGFTNDARVHGANNTYKSTPADLLRLTVDINGMTDETVINFRSSATNNFDNDFDATKMFSNNTAIPQLYSLVNSEAIAINTLPELMSNVSVPLGFMTENTGNHTIVASDINSFGTTVGIVLEDVNTGTFTDLRQQAAYTFNASAGTDDSRFVVHFNPNITDAQTLTTNEHNIYSFDNAIYIANITENNTFATIYNVLGQEVLSEQLPQSSLYRIKTELSTGTYIVKITGNSNSMSHKIFIK